jgi:hypothetical protein
MSFISDRKIGLSDIKVKPLSASPPKMSGMVDEAEDLTPEERRFAEAIVRHLPSTTGTKDQIAKNAGLTRGTLYALKEAPRGVLFRNVIGVARELGINIVDEVLRSPETAVAPIVVSEIPPGWRREDHEALCRENENLRRELGELRASLAEIQSISSKRAPPTKQESAPVRNAANPENEEGDV